MEKNVVASFLLYFVIAVVFFFFTDFTSCLAMPQMRLIVYCLVTELIQWQSGKARIWVLRVQSMGLREKYPENRRKFSLIPLEALTRPHTYVYSHD